MNVNKDLLTKIETANGTFMVLTKTRYLFFFNMPRSSVMPQGAAQFVATPGFQVHYNTVDARVLSEWHNLLCGMLRQGLFYSLSQTTRFGSFPYTEENKHLAKYVKRFL